MLYREVVVNVHSITSRLHVHRLSSIPSVCQIADDREHSGSYQLPIVARFPTDGLLTASPIAASGNLIAWNHDMRTLATPEQSDHCQIEQIDRNCAIAFASHEGQMTLNDRKRDDRFDVMVTTCRCSIRDASVASLPASNDGRGI